MVRNPQLTPLTILALAALATQPQLASAERIYRCPQANGLPLFSGVACNSAHQLDPVIINRYAPSPLTKVEQRQLELLSNSAKKQSGRSHRKSPGKTKGSANPRSTISASTACTRHQEALRALQNRRRKGYKLSEAQRLENQEQSLRQNIRLTC